MNKEEQNRLIKECCKKWEDKGWYVCDSFPHIELNPERGIARFKATKELMNTTIGERGDITLNLSKKTNGKWKTCNRMLKTLMAEQFLLKRKLVSHIEFIHVNNEDGIPRLDDLELRIREVKKFKRRFAIEDKKDSDFLKVLLYFKDKRKFFWVRKTPCKEDMDIKIMQAKESLLNQYLSDEGDIVRYVNRAQYAE